TSLNKSDSLSRPRNFPHRTVSGRSGVREVADLILLQGSVSGADPEPMGGNGTPRSTGAAAGSGYEDGATWGMPPARGGIPPVGWSRGWGAGRGSGAGAFPGTMSKRGTPFAGFGKPPGAVGRYRPVAVFPGEVPTFPGGKA